MNCLFELPQMAPPVVEMTCQEFSLVNMICKVEIIHAVDPEQDGVLAEDEEGEELEEVLLQLMVAITSPHVILISMKSIQQSQKIGFLVMKHTQEEAKNSGHTGVLLGHHSVLEDFTAVEHGAQQLLHVLIHARDAWGMLRVTVHGAKSK